MKHVKMVLSVSTLWVLLAASCKKDNGGSSGSLPPINVSPDDMPSADNTTPSNVTITWQSASKKLSHDVYFAEYPRLKKLGGDTMFLWYHFGPQGNEWDNIALRKSFDGGTNWTAPEVVMADNDPAYYGFANPDMIELQNKWLMLAYTGRGRPDDNAHDNIQVRISKDRGATWGPPIIAARGRSWEPAMVQYPDGEIQLFFSSEAAWWNGSVASQQEIRMASSKDNGTSWSSSKTVAYTAGMRDGMATPIILKDNKGVVFPIESVNNNKSPWMIWSSMSARFNYAGIASTENNRRWLATSQNIWGGAPYLVQTTTGETILSVQDAGGRNIGADWKKNTMLVLVGNSVAQNFTNISYPWPGLPTTEGAYYSSMFLKNNNTLVILTTRNFSDGHSEIFWKEGTINR